LLKFFTFYEFSFFVELCAKQKRQLEMQTLQYIEWMWKSECRPVASGNPDYIAF